MEYLIKYNIKKIFLYIIWLSFFFCINLNPIEFNNFSIINKLRILSPLLLILLSILLIKDIKYKNLIQIDSIAFILIFFLYTVFNILNKENHLANLFWPLYMFLVYFFLSSIVDNEIRIKLIKLSVIILSIAFLFYFSLGLIEMIKTNNVNFYGIMGGNSSYSGIKNPPRSSGLARMAVILFSYFLIYFLITKSKSDNKFKFFITICFFATCANLFQSRTVSFIYVSTNLLLIIFFFKEIIMNKKVLLFTLLIPIIINSAYNYIKYQYSYQNFYNESFKTYDTKIKLLENVTKNAILRDTNNESLDSFSSGRFENWKKSYEMIILKPFVGFGAQSDRIYLNQSVHNSLIYTILSGGLIAGIIFILIQLRCLFFFIKFILNINYKKDLNLCFSIMLLIIIIQRSILETSFAVFSIDYLLYILSYLVIKNKLNINNQTNYEK